MVLFEWIDIRMKKTFKMNLIYFNDAKSSPERLLLMKLCSRSFLQILKMNHLKFIDEIFQTKVSKLNLLLFDSLVPI